MCVCVCLCEGENSVTRVSGIIASQVGLICCNMNLRSSAVPIDLMLKTMNFIYLD